MAALTAAAARKRRNVHLMRRGQELAIGTSEVVYHGSLVCYDESTGRMDISTAATGQAFLGVADLSDYTADVLTGDTSGTVKAKFVWGHEEKVPVESALTKAYTGCNVALKNDNSVTTLSNAGTAGVQIPVGQMVELDTDAWVAIRHFGKKDAP